MTKPTIELSDIQHQYPGTTRKALENLSMTVRSGEIFALLGANGGGKSTTLKILAGLLTPESGNGHVLGLPLNEQKTLRRRVGYMAQDNALAPHLTVIETLIFHAKLYGLDNARRRAEELMEHFSLADYKTTRIPALSGGWVRRLQMACALVQAPDLLILDEPTTGLDAVAKHDLWEEISSLASKGTAVVIATHDHMEAARADHGVFLLEGKTVAKGNADTMINMAPGTVLHDPDNRSPAEWSSKPGILGVHRDGMLTRVFIADGWAEQHMQKNTALQPCSTSLADAAFLFVAHAQCEHEKRNMP